MLPKCRDLKFNASNTSLVVYFAGNISDRSGKIQHFFVLPCLRRRCFALALDDFDLIIVHEPSSKEKRQSRDSNPGTWVRSAMQPPLSKPKVSTKVTKTVAQ